MPFFISPAYPDPRITNSCDPMFRSIEVREVIPAVSGLAGNWPALMITQSGSPNRSDSSGVGRISIVHMNSAWYGNSQITRTLMRCSGSQPAYASTTYSRGLVFR